MRSVLAIVASLVAAFLLVGGAGFLWWGWATQAAQTAPSGQSGANVAPTRLVVKPKETVRGIGRELETKGVIRSARAFALLGRDVTIHPGIYDFSPSEPPDAILRHLQKSDFATIRVTIPEGFTNRQIAERLKAKGLIADDTAFLNFVTTQGGTLKASFPPPANLEGFLFPDTYKIPLGSNPTQIVQRMVGSFDKNAAAPNAAALSASGQSLTDAVNVAAMIEREAEVDADRPVIASVLYNRLKKGMRLQIDATVQYARGVHVERLLYRDLEVDSPYNTYKHAGLPPGPICNPGLPSLQAALNPAKTDYLFYVGRPGQAHHFAKTYEEHLKNIALVRRENAAAKAGKENSTANAR